MALIEQTSDTSWLIELIEDPDTGDVLLTFPQEVLDLQGWKEGDLLNWSIEDGTNKVIITKSEPKPQPGS